MNSEASRNHNSLSIEDEWNAFSADYYSPSCIDSEDGGWSIWDDRIERAVYSCDGYSSDQGVFRFSKSGEPNGLLMPRVPVIKPPSSSATVSARGPPLPDPTPWCTFCQKRSDPDWPRHRDINWETGRYGCEKLRKKVSARFHPVSHPFQCPYCQYVAPNLEFTHRKKCPITKKIMCPILRRLRPCQKCGAYGDNAHTTGSCPERPDLEM